MARRGVAFACVDNGPSALSPAEERTHIALWAILKSPLLLSCDVRSLSEETLGLLLNKDMLQIFDDPAARQVAD
jgi:alpha-galactosidase